MAPCPTEVRIKAVERKPEPSDHEVIEASAAVAIVCGADSETADRYEARNDALRSIARRRDLPKGDVEALLAYLRATDDAIRIERVAALKNDVMNLLRNQDPPAEGLAGGATRDMVTTVKCHTRRGVWIHKVVCRFKES